MIKTKTIIQWLRQGGNTDNEHQPLMAGRLLVGIIIMAGLAMTHISLADEKAADIMAKAVEPIKDVSNMQELEGTTFHVINITEHDSVLPAELRLAGKESDWTEGVVGYVDGKEVPSGLLPAGDYVRLMACVPLKSRETKKVTFKKGKSVAKPDFQMREDGNRLVVTSASASWTLGPNGLEQCQRDGKIFALQETGIANGTLKATMTPAVCRVRLSATGGPGAREYLFYPNSSLWQVRTGLGDLFNVGANYRLVMDGSNTLYYSHPCLLLKGGDIGGVIDTTELQKAGMKAYHLMRPIDFGLMLESEMGLAVYPLPGGNVIKVNIGSQRGKTLITAVALDEQERPVLKKWHTVEQDDNCTGCGWTSLANEPIALISTYVFGLAKSIEEGIAQRSGSIPPIMVSDIGQNRYCSQSIWDRKAKSDTVAMLILDRDNNGPDMLNDRWYCLNNGKPAMSYEFEDANKDKLLDTVYLYSDWDKTGALEAAELEYPLSAFHDWTADGKIVPNCLLFGGRIDQDWFEFTYTVDGSFANKLSRKQMEEKVRKLGVKKFQCYAKALDLDADGDVDVGQAARYVTLETDYRKVHGQHRVRFDALDGNPFGGLLLDPLHGDQFGENPWKGWAIQTQWTGRGNFECDLNYIYNGIPIGGQDALVGYHCVDGDGLPEWRAIYDVGWIEDFLVFRPDANMVLSSVYLSHRHRYGKANSMIQFDGNAIYDAELVLAPIRKKTHYAYLTSFPNSRLMPKRSIKDATVTYRDKWGHEIRLASAALPRDWDGKILNCSKDPGVAGDWRESFHYDWDHMLAGFEGIAGGAGESGYASHCRRWEFCPDYAQLRQVKLYYSELDGRLHFKGATFGHATPYQYNTQKPEPVDALSWRRYIDESWFGPDCDFMRYYSQRHEAFFDENRDGYLDCFLADSNNDGWYEKRAWYDCAAKAMYYMENDILALLPYSMAACPEVEVLMENYDRLVDLKRMSEEKTPFLKAATIKTEPLSISVPGTNMWVVLSPDLQSQVLLDTAHYGTNIWRDLSPKGYSRLLTGLQRQKAVVRELKEKWSDETLRSASVLFVAPLQAIKPTPEELKALDSFMKRGGRCVVVYPDCSKEPEAVTYALKTDNPLVPNGKTAEWESPQGIELTMRWDARPKSYDVKINGYLRWDQTHLYLCTEIQDRDLINKGSGADIWQGDGIQFALADFGEKWKWSGTLIYSGDGPKKDEMVALGGKWQEYGMALTAKGPQVYRWIDVPGNRTGPVTGAKWEVIRQENRTVYQLALPWTEVGKKGVKDGAELGFSLVVWDRINDKEIDQITWGGGIANNKDPAMFRKLRLVAKGYTKDASPGSRVESYTDAIGAPYGIVRNNDQVALTFMIDPVFCAVFQDHIAAEVWSRFHAQNPDDVMKGVRKLYFNGCSLDVKEGAEALITYQDKIIGARTKVGKGELLAFCSETLLNNSQACFQSFAGILIPVQDSQGLGTPLAVKSDNNVFLDNLARYLVSDLTRFKVLESSNAQMTVEIAGAGKVYVNKGAKVTLGGKEAVTSKEAGDTVCFEIPASKDPIKLKISR